MSHGALVTLCVLLSLLALPRLRPQCGGVQEPGDAAYCPPRYSRVHVEPATMLVELQRLRARGEAWLSAQADGLGAACR